MRAAGRPMHEVSFEARHFHNLNTREDLRLAFFTKMPDDFAHDPYRLPEGDFPSIRNNSI